MSPKKEFPKHKHHKIRGSSKLIVNSELEKHYNNISSSGNIVCHDYLDVFRREIKQVVAFIERKPTNKVDAHLIISQESQQIIIDHFQSNNPYAIGFMKCLIKYFNNNCDSSSLINCKYLYKSSNNKKNMTHARMNCKKIVDTFVKKILSKMKSGCWTNITKTDICKYEAIEISVDFFCQYISFLVLKNLPTKIDSATFSAAHDIDKNLSYYYSKNSSNVYVLIPKVNRKNKEKLKQDCTTLLFCEKYNKNINKQN